MTVNVYTVFSVHVHGSQSEFVDQLLTGHMFHGGDMKVRIPGYGCAMSVDLRAPAGHSRTYEVQSTYSVHHHVP